MHRKRRQHWVNRSFLVVRKLYTQRDLVVKTAACHDGAHGYTLSGIRSFVHSFVHEFIHLSIHSFIL